ncbi:hypothetical protein GCM10010977_15390 [Citricoccus zhacaiensis]|uniref:Uncharacterized protein n=1 Tax=Citricoccus zhacaiensis TaxID=489142 RepID=A0ABQ2LY79_9MICC|nr:hypothetical protein GCM10010977_15390 [Citricoccus zhacaiensis]
MRLTTAMSRMRERKSTVRCAKRWTGCLNSGSTMGMGGVLLRGWLRRGPVQRTVRAILAGYRWCPGKPAVTKGPEADSGVAR